MEFWILGPPKNSNQLANWAEGIDFDGTITCSANAGHARPDKRSSNLRVILPYDGQRDFVWTWLSECLISDRTLELFKQKGFTGFQTRTATVRTRTKKQMSPYFELLITGWGGVASSSSGIALIEDCQACGHRVYSSFTNPSEVVNESTWDGSDFFFVWPLPRYIMVTDRVVQSVAEADLTGALFSKLSDLRADPDGTLTPGRLSRWMSEERAKELGASWKIV